MLLVAAGFSLSCPAEVSSVMSYKSSMTSEAVSDGRQLQVVGGFSLSYPTQVSSVICRMMCESSITFEAVSYGRQLLVVCGFSLADLAEISSVKCLHVSIYWFIHVFMYLSV